MNQGWQCPICKTVYAPHVDKCECDAAPYTNNDFRTLDPDTYKHLNEMYEMLKRVERRNPTPPVKWPVANPYELRDHPLFPRTASVSSGWPEGWVLINAE